MNRTMRKHHTAGLRIPSLLALIASLSFIACGPEPEADKKYPHILFVSVDTLRRDHCSLYGYERETTPVLKKLADRGVTFDSAYAPMSITHPSHSTMFTGLNPLGHRAVQNASPLGLEAHTLAERLKERGYKTGAVVSSFILDHKFGLDQGFDDYDDRFDPARSTMKLKGFRGHPLEEGRGFDQPADETTRKAIALLNENWGDAPYFLFVHYFDPHGPYIAPPMELDWMTGDAKEKNFLERKMDAYDAEIAYTDDHIGKLIAEYERLGIADETLIIVTSDHGEGFMDHNVMGHGVQVYEEQIRVPLVIAGTARVAEGLRIEEPVSLADLTPTLLGILGIAQDPEEFHGADLSARLENAAAGELGVRDIFFQRHYYERLAVEADDFRGEHLKFRTPPGVEVVVEGARFGVIADGWKFTTSSPGEPEELYDLANDPGEKDSLVAERSEIADALRLKVAEMKERYSRGEKVDLNPAIAPEDIGPLQDLGYLK